MFFLTNDRLPKIEECKDEQLLAWPPPASTSGSLKRCSRCTAACAKRIISTNMKRPVGSRTVKQHRLPVPCSYSGLKKVVDSPRIFRKKQGIPPRDGVASELRIDDGLVLAG